MEAVGLLFTADAGGLRRGVADYFAYSSAAIAKFTFWASLIMKVVIPTRSPCASNKPPPEEPFETALMSGKVGRVRYATEAVLPPVVTSSLLWSKSSKPCSSATAWANSETY
jgi:hypothetical protein